MPAAWLRISLRPGSTNTAPRLQSASARARARCACRAHRRARAVAPLRNVHGDPHAADRGLPRPKGQTVLTRLAALLLLFAAALPAQYVQAVEFPYYLYPRTLWERELVW